MSPAPKQETPTVLLVAGGVLKAAAMGVGLVGTAIGVMAAVGALTESGLARVGAAVVVTFVLPLAIADRLLPKDPTKGGGFGIVTDVLAVGWLGFTLAFAGIAHGATGKLLVREGDRLAGEGFPSLAEAAWFLGGVTPSGTTSPTTPPASASASAPPSGAASAPSPSSAAPPASASPPPASSGSAAPHAPPAKTERTPAELFKDLAPSVVTIFTKSPEGEGSGTGFLIDEGGTIATNHHVIEGAKAVKVKLMSGVEHTSVELLVDAPAADLALVHVPLGPSDAGAPPRPLALGDSDAVVVGERAISIGNPLGLEHTLTDGLVSARRMYEGRPWIQMSVPVSPGNSGGPLFDLRGEVIGITTQQVLGGLFGRAQNLNLAVPVNELKKLVAPTYPGRRPFGEAHASSTW
jgi:S1-C subfamily serine protease